MRIAVVVVALVIGCGGGKSAPAQQPPVSNVAPPSADAPPQKRDHCDCPTCSDTATWNMICDYADEICACTDVHCISAAGQSFAQKAAAWAEEARPTPREMTAAEQDMAKRMTKRITDCTKRITDEVMQNAGGGSGGTP